MLTLAQSAKSENVRQLAAADLMDRARVGLPDVASNTGNSTQGLSISINLGDKDRDIVDVTPE